MSTVSVAEKKMGTTAAILGIGTSVPVFQVDSQTSARFAARTSCVDPEHERKVNVLYRRSGIQTRGSVLLSEAPTADTETNEFYPPAVSDLDRGPTTQTRNDRYNDEAPRLAVQAALAALESTGISADEITHLVTVTCTGFNAPGIDVALIDQLGLRKTTERVQVGFMGCHGAINGLRAARGLVAANPGAKVLVCCVELCSLHFQYGTETDLIVSNALFADGASAMVVSQEAEGCDGPDRSPLDGSGLGWVEGTGSCLVPDSRDAMTWKIGDHGFLMTLSAAVPGLIERHLESFLSTWLGEFDESIESIGGWAAHPGGSRILSAVESSLNLPPDALGVSRAVLSEHGNMSSATMLFILERFAAASVPKPWLMLGFGPGLEIEVALIR